ncbi:N-acetylmuramoyl-L-alanine amidase [Thermomonospora amylolytica]|uniref:N-acetylmuramoyl-L-alanine amidase n=1 Tax=Thermomonospora amylolytica TaxID=1411117 RepID=UPI001F44BEF8|nr:N-acetylmuramoyl-L-alanine amidase [Thermomonospora amylolytica]
MGIRRCRSAAVVLALGAAALTACGGGDDGGEGARNAPAPTTATQDGGGSPGREEGSGLRGRTVVIDPGHNGGNARNPDVINRQVDIGNGKKACDTTGTATNAGYPEHAFTWDVSVKLRDILTEQGAKVLLTRPDDKGVGPCIDRRAEIGNRANADAVISVHADGAAPNQHGFHIIEPALVRGVTDPEMVEESHELSLAVRQAFRDGTGLPYSNYRGDGDAIDRRNDLGGLNLSDVPKIFIECGNMRNAGDAAKLSNEQFRERIAQSLAQGLKNYLS